MTMAKVKVTEKGVIHRGEPVPVGATFETSAENVEAIVSQGKGEAVAASRRKSVPEAAPADAAIPVLEPHAPMPPDPADADCD